MKKDTFFGDSIVKYKNNSKTNSWASQLIKLINSNSKEKFAFGTYSYVGLNSRKALELLPQILIKNKNSQMIVIQIGINDSWHYKSLNGLANVSSEAFASNLKEIYLKCLKYKIKNVIFLTYHKLLKNRLEINQKNLNQNLKTYINIIKKFCKNNNLFCIDIWNETKNIKSKDICLKLPDGVHLNDRGADIYSKIIYKKIKKKFYEKFNVGVVGVGHIANAFHIPSFIKNKSVKKFIYLMLKKKIFKKLQKIQISKNFYKFQKNDFR